MFNYNKIMEIYGEQCGLFEGLARYYSFNYDNYKVRVYNQLSVNIQSKAVKVKNRVKTVKRSSLDESFIKGKNTGLMRASERVEL